MADPDVWPPPTFRVYTRSGKYVGYGSAEFERGVGVYPPGGENDFYAGCTDGPNVLFPSGELAGRVDGQIIRHPDGSVAGEVRGADIYQRGELIGRIEGQASPTHAGGAALLLIIIDCWGLTDGEPRPPDG